MNVSYRHVRALKIEHVDSVIREIHRLWVSATNARQIKWYNGTREIARPLAATVCTIVVPNDKEPDFPYVARGYAFCSANDQFSRKKGRAISYGRALDALQARTEEITT